jgi:hypothetical protein
VDGEKERYLNSIKIGGEVEGKINTFFYGL